MEVRGPLLLSFEESGGAVPRQQRRRPRLPLHQGEQDEEGEGLRRPIFGFSNNERHSAPS